MAKFSANTHRTDPYKNFKFRVKWDGRYVLGVSKVAALESPGRSKFEPITLERGVTHDVEFERWANKLLIVGTGLGIEVSQEDVRKDLIIELYDENEQLALTYKVFRCWVSEYQALPELDANENVVAIQSITLENEGWERDDDVVEPH